ncbi:hypothetical protein BDV95DRAFT_610129 [Massariosphaeria phaeospora]|uniref:Ankyrin repeat-containing domain protein n=1 Tax=Massariosphaeria phaeospora TaxID=100035 RepID=A0A7C8M4L5_9PLEO|nr:hypothetical protein BDV95DRAFT_610129 [Massariosphaeria phaeospora]
MEPIFARTSSYTTRVTDNALVHLLMQALHDAGPQDQRWRATDEDGLTILHKAAIMGKVQSVSWILNQNPGLLEGRNDRQETVLEVVQEQLDRDRTGRDIAAVVAPDFTGWDENIVACMVLLNKLVNPSRSTKLRLKYGCTCGQCTAGFLSHRMRYTLKGQAGMLHGVKKLLMDGDTGEEFVEFQSEPLRFVKEHIRNRMEWDKYLRQGFIDLFSDFADCL